MKKLAGLLIGFFICIWFLPDSARAAESGTLTVTGLQEEDIFRCYEIADYSEESGFSWREAVNAWLMEEDNAYAFLTPEEYLVMQETEKKTFLGDLIMTMDKDALASLLSPEEQTGHIYYTLYPEEGLYLVLPKGSERVYGVEPVQITAEQTSLIAYDEEKYSCATLVSSLSNLTLDRGQDSSGAVWAMRDEKLQVDFQAVFPEFPDFYSAQNAHPSLCISVPGELDFDQESLKVLGSNISEESFTRVILGEATLFTDSEGNLIFIAGNATAETTELTYYLPNGSLLSEQSLEDALTVYNGLYGTSYTTENILMERGGTVVILSFTRTDLTDSVTVSYEVDKNAATSRTGIYENRLYCVYGVSPLGEPDGGTTLGASVCSYGIFFTVCPGEAFEDKSDGEAIIASGQRLTGAEFKLYSYVNSFPATDLRALNEAIAELGDAEYYTTPSEDGNSVKLYSLLEQMSCDSRGECSVGGIPKGEYLVMESTVPYGYEYTRTFLCIEQDDWDNDLYMEGNYTFDTLWLNYPGFFLPETGRGGTTVWTVVGITICLLALFLMAKRWGLFSLIRGKLHKNPKKK